MNTFSETEYATIRRHGVSLAFPVLSLGFVSALFLFFDPRVTESWQHQALLGLATLLAIIFWLIPSIRIFATRYVISSNRIVIRRGLNSKEVDQVSWNEINGVSVTKGLLSAAGDIHLHREFGQDLVLLKVAKAKKLSRELEQFLLARSKRNSN